MYHCNVTKNRGNWVWGTWDSILCNFSGNLNYFQIKTLFKKHSKGSEEFGEVSGQWGGKEMRGWKYRAIQEEPESSWQSKDSQVQRTWVPLGSFYKVC